MSSCLLYNEELELHKYSTTTTIKEGQSTYNVQYVIIHIPS